MKTFLCLLLCLAASVHAQGPFPEPLPPAIPLWSGGAPGSEARANEPEQLNGSNVSNVHNPTITPFLPAPEQASHLAVIICPGGGHAKLCLGHEGYALAKWFQERGIAAFVLKYRLARDKNSTYTIQDHAMADTRRAIRTVRARCAEWNISADAIGIIGFSAGGELAAFAAMQSDSGNAGATDPIERAASRPNFQALIYPGTSNLFTVETGMPPLFIACGYGDRPDISEGMASLYLKYKQAGVKAELHIYSNVGHGFGYRPGSTGSAGDWPLRFQEWLVDSGFLKQTHP
jgi:endo-1,4-beta-xylanase